jgi:hypothetical protein
MKRILFAVGLACVGLVCAALVCRGLGGGLDVAPLHAEPEAKPNRPVRPAWLVGVWEMSSQEGQGAVVLGADGQVSFTIKTGTEEVGETGGRWVVEGEQLVVTYGAEVTRFRIERLPDEQPLPRIRLLEPGAKPTAPVFTRRADPDPERPQWMYGTWASGDEREAARLVLLPDGRAREVSQTRSKLTATELRWVMHRGVLKLKDGDVTISQEIDFEPDPEGRLAMWFVGSTVVRVSFPPAQPVYTGPLVGAWDRVDSLVPVQLTFDPQGRVVRRRNVGLGTTIERGRFQTARGALGDVLKTESDAGRKDAWTFRLEPSRLTLTHLETGRKDVFQLVPGSPAIVARDALNAAAAAADTVAENAFELGARARVKAGPSMPRQAPPEKPGDFDPDDPGSATDPAPHDVIGGAEILAQWSAYVGESEEVLARSKAGNISIDAFGPDAVAKAEPFSAQARLQVEWIFEPNGRVRRYLRSFGAGGKAGEEGVLHHGKYEITGDVVTVHLEGEPEHRMRFAEGGLFLYDGTLTLIAQERWLPQGGPR